MFIIIPRATNRKITKYIYICIYIVKEAKRGLKLITRKCLFSTKEGSNGGIKEQKDIYCIYVCVFVCVCAKMAQWQIRVCVSSVTQLCLTVFSPMYCSPPGSSPHGIFQQQYWSGVPFPTPEDLPDPGIEPTSLASINPTVSVITLKKMDYTL